MVSLVLLGARDCLIALYYHFFFNFLIFYGIKPNLKRGMGSLGLSFYLLVSIFLLPWSARFDGKIRVA